MTDDNPLRPPVTPESEPFWEGALRGELNSLQEACSGLALYVCMAFATVVGGGGGGSLPAGNAIIGR